jgi:N-acyl-L-homoserine lactone synthetase
MTVPPPVRASLFGTGDLQPPSRRSLRLLVADTEAEKTAARAIEGQVFDESFGNSPEVMEQEYGRYADRSRYVVVLDDSDGTALGAARFIVPDATGELKTLTDVAGEPWHLSVSDSLRAAGLADRLVWDVATLAVARRHRGGVGRAEVTLALCHGLFEYSRASGVDGWVTILDDRVLRLLRMMGMPWTAMAGARSQYYLGSPASTPCVCRTDDLATHMRDRRPDVAPAILDGVLHTISVDPADLHPSRGAAVTTAR